MDTWTDEDGIAYVSCSQLCVGSYGGAGSVGEANIRSLEDREDSIIRHWPYYTRQLFLADTEENRELVQGLEEDYCILDEETHSEVEIEWEQEAWSSWLCKDLVRTLPEPLLDYADCLDSKFLWEAYRASMEACNQYPISEYNGMYIRIDSIKDHFADLVAGIALDDSAWVTDQIALLEGCPVCQDGSELAISAVLDWWEETGKTADDDDTGFIALLQSHYGRVQQ